LCRGLRLALTIAALALSCAAPESARDGSLVDDAGRVLAFEQPPRRIVSLSPATTELLFALGAGERVVGRTRWCVDPPEAERVASVGDGLNPNIELVVAQRPELVLFYHSPMNDGAIAQLDRFGIASASVKLDGLADLRRAAILTGRVTGDSVRADSIVQAFERDLEAAAAPGSGNGPTVLLLAWDNPPIVIGATSFLSEVGTLAGGRNAFADLEQPSATVSIEAIAARDPDMVLLAGGSEDPDWARRPEWQVVRAVAERRMVAASGTEFSHPSFRAPHAVARLRAALQEAKP
jgi:iron complex transport system substrate-binding protein